MLQEISSLVELARDHAILGFYPESLSIFEQAMSLVNSALKSPNELDLNQNWNRIKSDLNEEYSTVRQANITLTRLRPLSGISTAQQQVVPLSRQEPNNGFPIAISNNHYRGPAELGRFRGLPFSHHKTRDPIESIEEVKASESFSELPSISEGSIMINPKPISKPKSILKPSVVNTKTAPKPNKQVKIPAKSNPPSLPKSPSFNRNLSSELSLKPRKSFMEYIYPDGQGPNSELIQLIEKEIIDNGPGVSLEDIAELNDAKSILNEVIILPSLMPEFFTGIRRPWKGILLFGPPGTGKTMLAKAVASMGGTTFFNLHSSVLISKWVGESEKLVRLLFEMARFYAPSTIFIDEIDSIVSQRRANEHETSRRIKTEMLIQLDGVSAFEDPLKRVIVMAATNIPWDIDAAMIRRLEKRIYVPLPSKIGRRKLFEKFLGSLELGPDIDWELLVKNTRGYSGADISCACREAAMTPLRKLVNKAMAQGQTLESIAGSIKLAPLTMNDLIEALSQVKSSISKSSIGEFEKWMKSFGSN